MDACTGISTETGCDVECTPPMVYSHASSLCMIADWTRRYSSTILHTGIGP